MSERDVRFAPVPAPQRFNRPLDAICGARAARWDDEVCVLPIGHVGLHRDYVGGAWAHDVRRPPHPERTP